MNDTVLTEHNIEEQEIRNHERECEVKKSHGKRLLDLGDRNDERFRYGIQQSECAKCRNRLLKYIQGSNARNVNKLSSRQRKELTGSFLDTPVHIPTMG